MNRRLLGYFFAAIIFAGLVYFTNLDELIGAFRQLTVGTVTYLLFISFVLVYISALKWKIFLESFGGVVSLSHLLRLYLVGYFVNLLLPSYLGGDAVRSWYAGKKVGQHEALAATILERYTGIVAMAVLSVIFVWFVPVATVAIEVAVIGLAVALAGITLIALSDQTMNALLKVKVLSPVLKHLKKIQAGLQLASRNHKLVMKAFGLSFLFHTMTVVNTLACAAAVGWLDASVGQLFVVLPLILIIGAIPLTPNGLGLQEGAFYFFLVGVGATPAQALGVAVLLRAKGYVLALMGGVCWLAERRR